jgi:archaellin
MIDIGKTRIDHRSPEPYALGTYLVSHYDKVVLVLEHIYYDNISKWKVKKSPNEVETYVTWHDIVNEMAPFDYEIQSVQDHDKSIDYDALKLKDADIAILTKALRLYGIYTDDDDETYAMAIRDALFELRRSRKQTMS